MLTPNSLYMTVHSACNRYKSSQGRSSHELTDTNTCITEWLLSGAVTKQPQLRCCRILFLNTTFPIVEDIPNPSQSKTRPEVTSQPDWADLYYLWWRLW